MTCGLKSRRSLLLIPVVGLSLLFLFQNCGRGFEAAVQNGAQNESSVGQGNAPVVTVTPPPTGSGNPNAKFSYISANILQGRCVSCHSSAQASGGVNLSGYANVSKVVIQGDATVSSLYQVVVLPNPVMPLGSAPLTVNQVQDIKDWIDDGGLNN